MSDEDRSEKEEDSEGVESSSAGCNGSNDSWFESLAKKVRLFSFLGCIQFVSLWNMCFKGDSL